MIKLDMPVIVEGKYDKITLSNIIDAPIIPTNGFGIFKDKEKCRMIRLLAQKNGIVVLTDSDSAGNLIRAHIKNIVGECRIFNVYTPRIEGKEKRKTHISKEGVLGVEGMTAEIIETALIKSGVTVKKKGKDTLKITKADLFSVGLSGGESSSEKRKGLLRFLELPDNLSPNAMMDVLNTLFTPSEFFEVIKKWEQEAES